jgi:hypothetical protein
MPNLQLLLKNTIITRSVQLQNNEEIYCYGVDSIDIETQKVRRENFTFYHYASYER